MKKIKIVHIITSLEQGGAQLVLYQLLQLLDKNIFEHHVIYFYGGVYVEKIRSLHISLYQVNGLISPFDIRGIYQLGSLIKKLNPTIMHTLLWAANFLGRWYAHYYGIKHIQVLHNNVDQNGFIRNFLDRISYFIEKNNKVTHVAVSDGIAHSVQLYSPWILKNSLKVITNGIDIKNFKTSGLISRSAYGFSENNFIIGAVGRLEWVKNYPLLLTVFALIYDQYPDAYLMIIGSGTQEFYLKKRAYDLGIDDRVIFVVGQDASFYYDLFDCFIMTSYKEGISMALLEAMGHAVVPIVMAIQAKHDVVDHNNGILCYSDEPEEFVNAIDTIIKNKNLKITLGQEAKFTVINKFKIESMIQKYTDLYIKMADVAFD